jgi:hypothetical protein
LVFAVASVPGPATSAACSGPAGSCRQWQFGKGLNLYRAPQVANVSAQDGKTLVGLSQAAKNVAPGAFKRIKSAASLQKKSRAPSGAQLKIKRYRGSRPALK